MTGIFITARLGSTRLFQKHLIKVNGITFIEYLVKRLEYQFNKEIAEGSAEIFITTSDKEENKEFEEVFIDYNLTVFYGSDNNIPLRHLECAERYKIDNIISIDGDDILCSTNAASLVYKSLANVSKFVKTKGLPLGMNVMGYSTPFLKDSLKENEYSVLETGWGKIFDDEKSDTLFLEGFEKGEKIRMTLDYPEDALFFKSVIEKLGDNVLNIEDSKLINFILENGLETINESLHEEYWKNFYAQKKSEN